MASHSLWTLFSSACLLSLALAQTGNRANPNSPVTPAPPKPTNMPANVPPYANSSTPYTYTSMGGGAMGDNPTYNTSALGPPDVWLRVPTIGVKKIELDVDNLQVELNLAANVANLVNLNVGVYVAVKKVNLTISDVGAEAELIIRLKPLVEIVNRVFKSLDLNPLLISAIDDVTSVVDNVVGAVDGLLGAITRGDTKLSFIIDNLGNIVQNVAGGKAGAAPQSQIVGNYVNNMTYTGQQKTLQDGNVQKTYKYDPLGSLVNITFDKSGNVVSAAVQKPQGGQGAQGGQGGQQQQQQQGMGQQQQQVGGMQQPQAAGGAVNPNQMGGMQQPQQQQQSQQQQAAPQQQQQAAPQQQQQAAPQQQQQAAPQQQQQAAQPPAFSPITGAAGVPKANQLGKQPQQQAAAPAGQQQAAAAQPKLERRAGSQVINPPPSPIR